jgi:hypothetical protein
MMNSDLPNNHAAKLRAIATLANLATSSAQPTYRAEAAELMQGLKLEKPLFITSDGKNFKIEKEGDRIKATELKAGG